MVLAFASCRRYNTRVLVSVSTEQKTDRAWVEVDLGKLVENARAVRAAHDAALLPLVKADGYGLGAVPVAAALETLDPWGFGVATTDEGVELRGSGIVRPIVVFTPGSPAQFPRYREHELTPVFDDTEAIARWSGPYHCEIDTGMGRAGIRWDDTRRLQVVADHPPEGVFTHFHSADRSPESVEVQVTRFKAALALVGERPRLLHVANSAGAWRAPAEFDLVRPGIFLYGGEAGQNLPPPEPVVAVRASIASVRGLAAGDTVSYGAEWSAPAATTVATLAIGYADGVRRAVQGRAEAIVAGRRYPVVGRVTMDMTVVDLGSSGSDAVRVGDVATLIGRDGEEEITLDEFAGWAGTISYEILTGLGSRLERIYTGP